jgi:ABC-2 type transport system ATP-binding protein
VNAVAELVGVTKRFGRVTALDSIDIAVHRGETLALLGPNGAGKSTAIAVLLGLRVPDAGIAQLNGRDPRYVEARRSVGVAPQETAFPPTLRVEEIIELVRRHYASPPSIEGLCDRFALEGLRRRQLGGLSGGERRLVAVCLAFAGAPDLVVLDEPTTGLDVQARRVVWRAIGEHVADGGTVLLTTHHLEEAEALAKRIVVVETGRIVIAGSVGEIKSAAGLTRVSLRLSIEHELRGAERDGDRVHFAVSDGGALVEELVSEGVPLHDLEVRPLTLEEALAHLAGAR